MQSSSVKASTRARPSLGGTGAISAMLGYGAFAVAFSFAAAIVLGLVN